MSLSSLKGQNDLSAADWCCCRVTATPLPALLTQSHTCPGSPPGCHSSTVITKCCLAAVQSLHPHCNMPKTGISLANIANALRNGEKSGVLLLNYLSLFVSTQLHTLRIAVWPAAESMSEGCLDRCLSRRIPKMTCRTQEINKLLKKSPRGWALLPQ